MSSPNPSTRGIAEQRAVGTPAGAPWRSVGFWLAAAIAVLQAFNAVRAFTDPPGFAGYMGLPLEAASDAGWVRVYGLRSAFIALAVSAMLITCNMKALAWIALAGVVMPLGDALLANQAGAPVSTVVRHAAIAVYLVVTFVLLLRWTRSRAPA